MDPWPTDLFSLVLQGVLGGEDGEKDILHVIQFLSDSVHKVGRHRNGKGLVLAGLDSDLVEGDLSAQSCTLAGPLQALP